MSDQRIDVEGDLWQKGEDGSWYCVEYPNSTLPNINALYMVYGPLTDPYEDE